ncbi:AfsR/SARP family transcriptional regulator [Actinophytocola sediminis]
MHRVRSARGDPLPRNPGYLLRINLDLVDLHRFHHLARDGRAWLAARSWVTAADVLGEATALWRGPVVADLVEAGINWAELGAIRSARLSAFEDQMDAELAIGRHHEVSGQLESALAEDPMRERICGQLMVALYRSGRQAEALKVYQNTRRTMVEQVGLDPSPALQQLQQSILNHDMTRTA